MFLRIKEYLKLTGSKFNLPVEESPFAQQQLHHLGVALPRGQVEWRQALLVALIQQARVSDALQKPVACIDSAIPFKTLQNKQRHKVEV